jgi:hypothetical protein
VIAGAQDSLEDERESQGVENPEMLKATNNAISGIGLRLKL